MRWANRSTSWAVSPSRFWGAEVMLAPFPAPLLADRLAFLDPQRHLHQSQLRPSSPTP